MEPSSTVSATPPRTGGALGGAPTPAVPGSVPAGGLRSLIHQKERELHDINEYRLQTLESLVADREREAAAAREQLAKVKEDFTYNLKLLEERDKELERCAARALRRPARRRRRPLPLAVRYDDAFAQLRAVVRERDAELSELRIASADAAHEAASAREAGTEAERYFELKLSQAREEAETMRWRRDEDVRGLREALEAQQRESARQLAEASEALQRERREAAQAFDDESRARSREAAVAADRLATQLREAEAAARAAAAEAADAHKAEGRQAARAAAAEARAAAAERLAEEAARGAEATDGQHRERAAAAEAAAAAAAAEVAAARAAADATQRERAAEREGASRREAEASEVSARLERRVDDARAETAAARAAAEGVIQELRTKLEAAVAEGDAARRDAADCARRAEAAEAVAARRAAEAEAAEAAASHAREEVAALQGQRDEARRETAAARRDLADASAAAEEAEAALDSRADMSVTAAQALRLRAEAADRFEELSVSLQAKLREAEAAKAEAEAEVERVRAEMVDAQVRATERAAAAESAAAAARAAGEAAAGEVRAWAEQSEAEAARLRRLLLVREGELAAAAAAAAGYTGGGGRAGRAAHLRVETPAESPTRAFPSGILAGSPSGLRGGPAADALDEDDDESLPSPPSVPASVAMSPAVGGKWAVLTPGGIAAGGRGHGGCESVQQDFALAHLQEENAGLRRAVRVMRQEMQALRRAPAHGDAESDALEISEGGARIRHLEHHAEVLALRLGEAAKGAGGDGGAALAAAEIGLLRSRVAELEKTRARLQSELRHARAQAAPPSGISLPSEPTETVKLLQRKLSAITSALAERTREAEALRASADGGEAAALRARLAEAEGDVARLAAEREKLMDISNMLRADLNRMLAEGGTPDSRQGEAAAVERAERAMSQRYESKLGEIEAAMRELVLQNRALKAELRRWTSLEAECVRTPATGGGGGPGGGAGGAGERGGGGGGRCGGDRPATAAGRTGGGGGGAGGGVPAYLLAPGSTSHATAAACRCAVAEHTAGGGGGHGPVGRENRETGADFDAVGGGLGGAAYCGGATDGAGYRGGGSGGVAYCGGAAGGVGYCGGGAFDIGIGFSNVRTGDMHGGDSHSGGGDGCGGGGSGWCGGASSPAPHRPSEFGASRDGNEDARMRARDRLEAARESLSLCGSNTSFSERPAALGQTARGTSSQTKARLQDIQRKRADLTRRRGSVRNWADASPE